jgi:hypothetical protein
MGLAKSDADIALAISRESIALSRTGGGLTKATDCLQKKKRNSHPTGPWRQKKACDVIVMCRVVLVHMHLRWPQKPFKGLQIRTSHSKTGKISRERIR